MTPQSRPFNASSGILIDTATKLTLISATNMWIAGARGVWRYFFFGSPRPQDLDAAELQMLLSIGYWVGGCQHVPNKSWIANGVVGLHHSQAAVSNAIRAGYITPAGQHPIALALDAEGVGNPGPQMVDYARAGFQTRVAQAYQPIGYNGFDCGLRGVDLDAFNADASCGGDMLEWWCDFAALAQRPAPKKGYAGHQKPQSILGGTDVDVDTILHDNAIYGLIDIDLNAEIIDPRTPTIPSPDYAHAKTEPPPPTQPE